VTVPEDLGAAHSSYGETASAGEPRSGALRALEAAMVKHNRNLAEVMPRGEIFPEMNLRMIVKSKTDKLG